VCQLPGSSVVAHVIRESKLQISRARGGLAAAAVAHDYHLDGMGVGGGAARHRKGLQLGVVGGEVRWMDVMMCNDTSSRKLGVIGLIWAGSG